MLMYVTVTIDPRSTSPRDARIDTGTRRVAAMERGHARNRHAQEPAPLVGNRIDYQDAPTVTAHNVP